MSDSNPIVQGIGNLFSAISRIFSEREDLFNSFDNIGIAWSEEQVKLIKRKGRIKDSDVVVVGQIYEEMLKNREKRIEEYKTQFKKNIKDIRKAKTAAISNARIEIKNQVKNDKIKLKLDYGFFEGRKKFKEQRESYQYGQKMSEAEKHYLSLSSIPELEYICREASDRFYFETSVMKVVLKDISKRISPNLKIEVVNMISNISSKDIPKLEIPEN